MSQVSFLSSLVSALPSPSAWSVSGSGLGAVLVVPFSGPGRYFRAAAFRRALRPRLAGRWFAVGLVASPGGSVAVLVGFSAAFVLASPVFVGATAGSVRFGSRG